MRGRKPKPTRLKMLTGEPGKRPLNGDELRPEANIPECPPELGPLAKQEWDRLVGELAALRLLTNLDRAALAAYCGAFGQHPFAFRLARGSSRRVEEARAQPDETFVPDFGR